MTGDESTLTGALEKWRAAGYRTDFSADPAGLRCGACGTVHDPSVARVDHLERFEGASNPDDEEILLAITCSHCATKGVLVAAYGPSASAAEAAVLTQIRDGRP